MKYLDIFVFVCTMLSCFGLGYIYSETSHIGQDSNSISYSNSSEINYYPKFANISDVDIKYLDNSTIITINKRLLPVTISCKSFSMATWLGCGNYGFKEEYTGQKLFVGDVIIFKNPWNETGTVIHQIINITDDCVFTKGTNNKYPDDVCLKRPDIEARMWFMLPTSNDSIS